jgi:hypothetical protein
MFFEPLPVGEEPDPGGVPERPPWSGPPGLETGTVLPIERTVARSANVVVLLPTIRAFQPGCMLDVEVVSRQDGLCEDDWWDLCTSAQRGGFGVRGGAPLPDKLLRLGVRYADGTKATTVDQHRKVRAGDDPPPGPMLSWWPGSSGQRGRGLWFNRLGLWLWPLPPAEAFEFAVEWPLGGIELTTIELDGAAIVTAAKRSGYYWPDSQ